MKSIRLRAFAKINIGLRVLSKRADGYHELRTVYQTVDLHDSIIISLTAKPGIELRCSDPTVPSGRENLVYQACRIWKKANKFSGGMRVDLEKRIPSGAGLGGGSSDAAVTLLGLDRLNGCRTDSAAMFRLAADLGSDAPLFLIGGRVLGCGRGEEVYPLTDIPRRRCLIVHPGFPVSTPYAFGALDLALTTPSKPRKLNKFGVWSQFPLHDWGPAENDFERVVFAKWPELGRIKDQFIRAGAEIAALTGSGSALYAIFVSARQLRKAARLAPVGWSVFMVHTLSRAEYWRRVFSA